MSARSVILVFLMNFHMRYAEMTRGMSLKVRKVNQSEIDQEELGKAV